MSCPRRLAGTALLARSGNASSNSISAFAATPRGLRLIGTIGSGGTDPDSVTIAGDHLVYMLNADSKTIAGFWLGYRGLRPIPGSVRPLGAGVLTALREVADATIATTQAHDELRRLPAELTTARCHRCGRSPGPRARSFHSPWPAHSVSC